jgi:hypothetical protein
LSLIGGYGLYQNEMGSRTKDRANLRGIVEQRDGYRRFAVRTAETATALEDQCGCFRIVEVDDNLIEALLLQSSHGDIGSVQPIHGNPELRLDLNQRFSRQVILRHQQCLQYHGTEPLRLALSF